MTQGDTGHAVPGDRCVKAQRAVPTDKVAPCLPYGRGSASPDGRVGSVINARSAYPSNVCGRIRRSGSDTEKPRLASFGVPATFATTRNRGPSNSISLAASAPFARSVMRISVASSFHGMSMTFPPSMSETYPVRAERSQNNALTQIGSIAVLFQAVTLRRSRISSHVIGRSRPAHLMIRRSASSPSYFPNASTICSSDPLATGSISSMATPSLSEASRSSSAGMFHIVFNTITGSCPQVASAVGHRRSLRPDRHGTGCARHTVRHDELPDAVHQSFSTKGNAE